MKKLPDPICSWDFCESCINYRIRNNFPLTGLRSSPGYTQYFRVTRPDIKPSQPRKNIKNYAIMRGMVDPVDSDNQQIECSSWGVFSLRWEGNEDPVNYTVSVIYYKGKDKQMKINQRMLVYGSLLVRKEHQTRLLLFVCITPLAR